jgi:4-hydroxy-4-methyl-2-oxoglutarate aldolase
VWSTDICAQGTVKSTAGAVNVPVIVGGQRIHPGDAVLADDDGVLVVPRGAVAAAVIASRTRAATEEETRAALAGGELGLDRYRLRPLLDRLGVAYVHWADEAARGEPR